MIANRSIDHVINLLRAGGVFQVWNDAAQIGHIAGVCCTRHLLTFRKEMPNVLWTDDPVFRENGAIWLDCRLPFTRRGAFSNVTPFFLHGVARALTGSTAFETVRPRKCSRSYTILATPRSGSTFLCDLLSSTECMGMPTEHLKPWIIEYLGVIGISFPKFYKIIQNYATTANGVFGTKIIIDDLFSLLNWSNKAVLDELRRGPVFLLIRCDKSAQAFSNVRSEMLSVYHFHDIREVVKVAAMKFVPRNEQVFSKERWLLRQEADLLDILAKENIDTRIISYEAIIQSKRCARVVLERLFQDCGVSNSNNYVWPTLTRIGAVAHRRELMKYRDFREGTYFYSARAEPPLEDVLGQGWSTVEHWGVRMKANKALIVAPATVKASYYELLLRAAGDDEGHLAVEGVALMSWQGCHSPELWRVFGRIDAKENFDITIERISMNIEIEEVVLYESLTEEINTALLENKVCAVRIG